MRVAHQTDFAPFVYVKGGKSSGLIIDIINAAAARERITIVFVPVPFAQLDATLTNGKADAITPLAITPDRRKKFDFSSTLVLTGGGLFVRAPNPTPAGLATLSGRSIATPKTGPFVSYIRKTVPSAKLLVTSGYPNSFEDVINGKADAAALNIQVGASMVATSYAGTVTVPKTMFTAPLPYGVAVTLKANTRISLKSLTPGSPPSLRTEC
ncbi:MAG TPA: transporter substrate-binding domain-containing protein [Candidatus Tumulicola sp.]|jgi:polar amino acid transport system substrate-binding protein